MSSGGCVPQRVETVPSPSCTLACPTPRRSPATNTLSPSGQRIVARTVVVAQPRSTQLNTMRWRAIMGLRLGVQAGVQRVAVVDPGADHVQMRLRERIPAEGICTPLPPWTLRC